MELKKIVAIVLAVIVVVGIAFLATGTTGPGPHDALAQCLTAKGAKFYGAFWCPHCHDQKDLFGSSMKYVNYIECSTPDGTAQLPVCTQAGINTYPTWVFADGSKQEGVTSLADLAAKTGCSYP